MCVDCVEAYVPLRPPASNALCGSELSPAHQLLYHALGNPRELAACKTLGMPSKHRASYYVLSNNYWYKERISLDFALAGAGIIMNLRQ